MVKHKKQNVSKYTVYFSFLFLFQIFDALKCKYTTVLSGSVVLTAFNIYACLGIKADFTFGNAGIQFSDVLKSIHENSGVSLRS